MPDDVVCRICPGRHIAISSLYLSIASILSVFRIEKAIDDHGNVIEPSKEYISALILCVFFAAVVMSRVCGTLTLDAVDILRRSSVASNLGPRGQRR